MTAYRSRFARLLADRGGNFAATTALLLPVLLGIAGVSIDYMRMSHERNRVQDATDSAALAAASALAAKGYTEDQARALALSFLRGQMAAAGSTVDETAEANPDPNAPFSSAPQIEIVQTPLSGNAKKFTVSIQARYTVGLTGFTKVLGVDDPEIVAFSKTTSQTAAMSALSMYLVLDKSGSMAEASNSTYTYSCGTRRRPKTCTGTYTKIESLKIAVETLTTTLDTSDPDQKYVRTGAVSYNDRMQTPSDLAWGTSAALTYVKALQADGYTDSSKAFQKAYDSLVDSGENGEHLKKNSQVPKKFIVLMTDGENNRPNADTETKKYCDKARADNITVYTVAFMAPKAGQELLSYCATSASNYFAAENTAELVSAFKSIAEKASQLSTRLTN